MLLKFDWEIVVEEPVNVVFDAFIEQMWDVMSGGIETEVRELTAGPMSPGSSYLHTAEHRSGKRVQSKITVEAYELDQSVELSWSSGEPGHWVWLFGGAGLGNLRYAPAWGEEGSRLEVRFSEVDTGTQIRAHSQHHLTGALVPLSSIMRWPAHRRVRRKLWLFKGAVEGEAQNAATNG
ncbi:MAG TPA: hypothetical protein VLA91_08115 [Acidimicrobiia bacterium]|nr:hypothetical protein [Acidimicrobiia bacterium]